MSPARWQSVSRLGIALLAALLVGLATGRIALAFALVLALYAGVQLWNLLRLEHWLRRRRIEEPPDVSGVWGEVVAIVSRIYRRKQFHRARVTALLREFRRLTTAMPEGAVLLGPEHEILWFNHRAADDEDGPLPHAVDHLAHLEAREARLVLHERRTAFREVTQEVAKPRRRAGLEPRAHRRPNDCCGRPCPARTRRRAR
jgi:two-component system phosphate regulon sensor histidine kinase PhoR